MHYRYRLRYLGHGYFMLYRYKVDERSCLEQLTDWIMS